MHIPEDSIVLADKPAGWSSFKAVAVLRRVLSQQIGRKAKVGHAGTLDPFATGLLILLTGKACKDAATFLKLDKIYEVEATLGEISTTGDPEGELTVVSNRQPSAAEVHKACTKFVGSITQTPPAFSAIKINGVRAYQLARKGQDVQLKARPVTVYALELLDYSYPQLRFRCHVSSGTYIRSLVQDIGRELGVGAYTTRLRRTRIGEYSLQQVVCDIAALAAPKNENTP